MKKHILALTVAVFLGACASGGTVINVNGHPEGDVKWPKAFDNQLSHETGRFPNLHNLSKVRPSMSRDQLYQLIGTPHYTEGFHVREWTYLFHFNTPGIGKEGISTCQYKVLFDDKLHGQSYFWRPINPQNGTCPPSVEKAPMAIQTAPQIETFRNKKVATF